MIAIIDYGMGNLASVYKAFRYLGQEVRVCSHPRDLKESEAMVLPGVGAMRDAMMNLSDTRFPEAIHEWIAKRKPFLGICLGMQMLFDTTEEGACETGEKVSGLGIISGKVVRFPEMKEIKIPHMGWNRITETTDKILPEGNTFYFVHSYHACPDDSSVVTSRSFHGVPFVASVRKDCITAFQFHPEKSGDLGIRLLRDWIRQYQRDEGTKT